jgi:hypothetical protein
MPGTCGLLATVMHTGTDREDKSPGPLEVDARAALDLLAKGALTKAEWAAARARLLEFAAILRNWARGVSGRGNVEGICQRED